MKWAQFSERKGGTAEVGAVRPDGIVALGSLGSGVPKTIREVMALEPGVMAELNKRIQAASPTHKTEAVHFLPPISDPRKILAIGLNYAAHLAETGRKDEGEQIWFAKLHNALNAHQGPILVPRVSTMVDYEAELVIVIARRCRYLTRANALDAVFGATCGNDVSVRDWQFKTPQFLLGKTFDGHAPVGPWIVTRDELGDLQDLDIECRVNGERMQYSNTKHMIHSVADQIAHVSQAMTLEPGDLIFTGTPEGVGAARKPPVFLKPGDRVEVTIARIGTLSNPVEAEGT